MQGREGDPRIWTNTDVQPPVKDMARMRPNTSAGLEKNMEHNLTSGSVVKNIAKFSLPYLLSYFLQTLYGMADLFIIGQFDGVAGTTAVAVGSQIMHMLTVMLVGLAMGSTVCIARAVGAGNGRQAARDVGNTVTLFMGVAAALTVVLLLLIDPIVAVMSTPGEAVAGTRMYLMICFIGIPCITAYNIISSIFRGLGDSKSPMYFIAVACAANIALDYLFMGALNMGPAGAALGTTLAQAISVAIALISIRRKKTGLSLTRADFKPDRAVMGKLMRIGVPVALQDGFIQIAFLFITVIANQRGLTDSAAVGIVEKIISFVFLSPVVDAVHCIGAVRAEHWRGQARPRECNAALCNGDNADVRRCRGHNCAVRGRRHGWPVYARRGRNAHGRAVPARLYLGLRAGGHTLLLQRLLLRIWPLRNFVPA